MKIRAFHLLSPGTRTLFLAGSIVAAAIGSGGPTFSGDTGGLS
jgi:hypothetical protein